MQITCPGCGKLLSVSNQLRGGSIRCSRCNTQVDIALHSTSSGPLPPSFANYQQNEWTSDKSIIIIGLSGLGLIVLLLVMLLLWDLATDKPVVENTGAVEETRQSIETRTPLDDGLSIVLPSGFKQDSRETTSRGDVVYRFLNDRGFGLTIAIVNDPTFNRFDTSAKQLSDLRVKGVREFTEDLDAEVQPEQLAVDGLPATAFRYHVMETYRGITFHYYMVVMDHGRMVYMKFQGRYGDYDRPEGIISFPDHWFASMRSLRRDR